MTTSTVTASAGDAVPILIAKGTGSLGRLIELHAPGGSIVTSASCLESAAVQTQKLTQTGTHMILGLELVGTWLFARSMYSAVRG
jgi:hypothetical protein